MDTVDAAGTHSGVPGDASAVAEKEAVTSGGAGGIFLAMGGRQDGNDDSDADSDDGSGGVVFVAAVKPPPGQVVPKEEKQKSFNAIKFPESRFEEQPALLGVLFGQYNAGRLPVRTLDPLLRTAVEPGAYKPFASPDLVNKRNSEAHEHNAPLVRGNLNLLYERTRDKKFHDLARALSAGKSDFWLGLRMVIEGPGLNDPRPKQHERIVWVEEYKFQSGEDFKVSIWGGTLWQMGKKWADTNRTQTGGGDLDRAVEAGYAAPPVGDGATKAEVGRTAMDILSQHVAVIRNKAKDLMGEAALGEQQREMVRKTNKLGKIIGVCLALRTLNNPKTMPRSRSRGTPGAPAAPTAQHLALADHAGIGVEEAASLDFTSSSGGRVKSRGGYVENRADAEDAPGIVDRLKGGKDKAHDLRQSDYSPIRPKPGTKGYHLAVHNYHTAKLVQSAQEMARQDAPDLLDKLHKRRAELTALMNAEVQLMASLNNFRRVQDPTPEQEERLAELESERRAVEEQIKALQSTACAPAKATPAHGTATPASRGGAALATHMTPGSGDASVASSALSAASGTQTRGNEEEGDDEEEGLPGVDGAGGRRVHDVVAAARALGTFPDSLDPPRMLAAESAAARAAAVAVAAAEVAAQAGVGGVGGATDTGATGAGDMAAEQGGGLLPMVQEPVAHFGAVANTTGATTEPSLPPGDLEGALSFLRGRKKRQMEVHEALGEGEEGGEAGADAERPGASGRAGCGGRRRRNTTAAGAAAGAAPKPAGPGRPGQPGMMRLRGQGGGGKEAAASTPAAGTFSPRREGLRSGAGISPSKISEKRSV